MNKSEIIAIVLFVIIVGFILTRIYTNSKYVECLNLKRLKDIEDMRFNEIVNPSQSNYVYNEYSGYSGINNRFDSVRY